MRKVFNYLRQVSEIAIFGFQAQHAEFRVYLLKTAQQNGAEVDHKERLWCINRLFEDAIPNSGSFTAILTILAGEISQDLAENWL